MNPHDLISVLLLVPRASYAYLIAWYSNSSPVAMSLMVVLTQLQLLYRRYPQLRPVGDIKSLLVGFDGGMHC